MRPTYAVRAWRERHWWLARVVGASDSAAAAPIDGLAHARTLVKLEQAARDLVATILDTGDDTFDLEFEYLLPDQVEAAVCEAIGARTWLEAAQSLWEEHCAVAVHTLLRHGFGPSEVARLLDLPDDGIDELLDIGLDPDRRVG